MDYEKVIKEMQGELKTVKSQLNNLQNAFLQLSRNQVPITAKTDDTANQVVEITPYTESKKAYYGEKEKVFYRVPLGNLTVFFDNYDGEYKTERISDRLVITFPERLEDLTNITIKIEQ